MLTPFVRLAVVVLGVLPAPARQDAVTFDWTAYGHALCTQMPKCVADASALKRGLDGHVPLEINADHAALVYLHPEGPVVFDLWCDGRTQNTFAGFRVSVWKGMPAGEWARRMTLQGYTVSGCQEHPELGETPPLRLMELLAKLPK